MASRCSTEIILLHKQLDIISHQLSLVLRRKDIEDVVDLCQFHYENFLFRVYSVRERAWDILATLANEKRKKTGDKKFREAVLSKIGKDYQDLNKLFSKLLETIDLDVNVRNIATHTTFLFPMISFGEVPYAIDAVLTWYDPDSEEGLMVREAIRKSMREFVKQEKKHIANIGLLASKFAQKCKSIINIKKWPPT